MPRLVLLLICLANTWGAVYADTFEFSAPPRLSPAESRGLYGPLVELLGRETGETFRYVHSRDWFAYQLAMQRDRFDLVLDDAHFASWRIAARGHTPLARAPTLRYVVIADRAGKIYSKDDLVARALCADLQPDLGTLSVLREFKGPFRVPRLVETPAALDRVRRLLNGECAGAVLSRHILRGSEGIRRVSKRLKIIAQSDPYPGLTLTAGTRVSPGLRAAIQRVVLSRSGERATRLLRHLMADGGEFTEADTRDYDRLAELLDDYPGYKE